MRTIQVNENNGTFTCDVGITKEEWLKILEGPSIRKEFVGALLRFYYMSEHKGSCIQTSRIMGESMATLNSCVIEFSRFVMKRFGLEVIGTDGKQIFWLIPMGQGRNMGKDEDGTFEWKLREELVAAIEEYLYRYLVRQYKILRKEIPIANDKYDELYKWETIKDCKDKDAFFIVRYLCEKQINLIDLTRDTSIIKYMLEEKSEEYQHILSALTDDTTPLNDRLRNFKQAMDKVVPAKIKDKKIASKANDERMASAILTCRYPQQNTFYMKTVYTRLCQYLGLKSKSVGQRYEHFIELLKPLQQIVETDDELRTIVKDSLEGQELNSLLLAQDIVWMMIVQWPRRLDFIYPLVWRPTYWLVKSYANNESQLDHFVEDGVWEGRFKKEDKELGVAKKIEEGDILILKSTSTHQDKNPSICIRGIAVVTDTRKEKINNDGLISVIRTAKYINLGKKEFEGQRYDKYLSTTVQECKTKETEIIDYVNSILNMKQQKKYDKYTKLLRANYNLVLTGAPGIGKTYMAKAIAKEFGADDDSIEFVQFHPSYDYTDFVEGLRPASDANGAVGFERRDGVFKIFCKRALKNLEDSKKSGKELEEEKSFECQYNELIERIASGELEEVSLKTDGKKMEIVKVSDWNNIILRTPNTDSDRTYTVSFDRLKKLAKAFPDAKSLNEITNIYEAIINAIKGCNASSYWAVLNEVYKQNVGQKVTSVTEVKQKPFVFIIDEINRGEISKIFGELFFSIDPSYRGEAGRVNTQYQNLIEEGDAFKTGFFVPENVYVIGTMNDIDRSVESMDFAMRRRFVWQEVPAKESYEAMIADDAEFSNLKDEIRARMTNLNNAICSPKLGLGKAYQIGAAYFRKVRQYADVNPDTVFETLWDNHLKCLLVEYLRGNPNAEQQLEKLHDAYKNTKVEDDHNDNGQPQTGADN